MLELNELLEIEDTYLFENRDDPALRNSWHLHAY
jgi:hypothetical protein